jgi:hypothetical protein
VKLAVIQFRNRGVTEDVLEEFAEDVQQGIKNYLRRHTRGTGRLESSIRAYVYGREIIVESDVPYAKTVDQGTLASKTMWNLINQVIPLKLKDGRTIFRKVTLDSIRRGKWQTKPRPGKEYIERGVELARSSGSVKGLLDLRIVKPSP